MCVCVGLRADAQTCRFIPAMTRASRNRSRRRTVKKLLGSSSLDRKNWDESARASLENLRDSDVVHHSTTPVSSPATSRDFSEQTNGVAGGEQQVDAGAPVLTDVSGQASQLDCELQDPDGHYEHSTEPSQQQNAKRALRRRLRIDSKEIRQSPLEPTQRPEIPETMSASN